MVEIKENTRRYIVLPDYGYRGRAMTVGKLHSASGQIQVLRRDGEPVDIRILTAIEGGGPKLVEMSANGELALRREYGPTIQIVPLTQYHIPIPRNELRRRLAEAALDALAVGKPVSVLRVVDRVSGAPVSGAHVLAFTSFRHKTGDEGVSDPSGGVALRIPPGTAIDRLYVYPPDGYWGHYRASFGLEAAMDVGLAPVDLASPNHPVRQLYGDLPPLAGAGIRVGIIDTGIDPDHPWFRTTRPTEKGTVIQGGRNCVFDETDADPATEVKDDYRDVDRHGTHVAGIVASNGALRGVAPGVDLMIYRVFPRNGEGASNFDVMTAINQAVADQCQIVNLSLGGPAPDPALRSAIGDAAQQGCLVVAAAGNEYHRPVSYPANYEASIAVTAVGRDGGFPPDSVETADRLGPFSKKYPSMFLAAFTNVGPLVDVTAPGVGICSAVPGGGHAIMSGTSMAAPVIAGYAAHLLASMQDWQGMDPPQRREELVRRLYTSAAPLGLGRLNEGFGLPLPAGGLAQL